MRPFLPVVATVSLLTAPALAGTFTETLVFGGSPSSGGDTVYGPVFDPALGTLLGVTMTAGGSYTPHVFVGAPVSSTAAILDVDLTTYGAGGGLTTVAAGGENLTYDRDGYLSGPGESFLETATVTNAAALKQVYTAFGPYKTGSLLGLDVFSRPATPGAWGGLTDDVSSYVGTLTVTYTYAVREPGTCALLGMGGTLTLALARNPRKPRPSGARQAHTR